MKTLTFAVISDPGHAWVKVNFRHLERIIGPHWRSCFSPYSYERGDHAYLEEDDDAATFIKACRGAGIEPRWRTRYANRESRVRHYDSLRTTAG
ncbi:MAG: hypothetical protein VKI63_04240 [Cyanobium sp.]|nr:hypothetical protein [Cyanobium sp.]